jgi:hypothetical protein
MQRTNARETHQKQRHHNRRYARNAHRLRLVIFEKQVRGKIGKIFVFSKKINAGFPALLRLWLETATFLAQAWRNPCSDCPYLALHFSH